jgi:hypothetical protein
MRLPLSESFRGVILSSGGRVRASNHGSDRNSLRSVQYRHSWSVRCCSRGSIPLGQQQIFSVLGWVVAINRNARSQSIGTAGHDRPLRALRRHAHQNFALPRRSCGSGSSTDYGKINMETTGKATKVAAVAVMTFGLTMSSAYASFTPWRTQNGWG